MKDTLRICHRVVVIVDTSRQDKIANQRTLSAQHWPATSQFNWIVLTFSCMAALIHCRRMHHPNSRLLESRSSSDWLCVSVWVCVCLNGCWCRPACVRTVLLRAHSSSCWPQWGITQPQIMSFNVLFHLSQWGGAQQTPGGPKVNESNSAWKQITQCRQAGNY